MSAPTRLARAAVVGVFAGGVAGSLLASATGCAPGPTAPPPPAPTLPAEAPPPETVHVVAPGDTLWEIAQQHGVTVEELMRHNQMSDADARRMAVGTRLAIPDGVARPTPARSHTVRPGETLSGIAAAYAVDVAELARVNALPDPDRLEVGTELQLPEGASETPLPVAPAPAPRQAAATARRDEAATAPLAARGEAAVKPPATADAGRPSRADAPPPAPATRASAATAPDPADSDPGYAVGDDTLLRIDIRLTQAEDRYQADDFDAALFTAHAAEDELVTLPDVGSVRRRRARAALIAGKAQAGLGQTETAVELFRAALQLDERTTLDASNASPEVAALFEQARAGR